MRHFASCVWHSDLGHSPPCSPMPMTWADPCSGKRPQDLRHLPRGEPRRPGEFTHCVTYHGKKTIELLGNASPDVVMARPGIRHPSAGLLRYTVAWLVKTEDAGAGVAGDPHPPAQCPSKRLGRRHSAAATTGSCWSRRSLSRRARSWAASPWDRPGPARSMWPTSASGAGWARSGSRRSRSILTM